MRGTCIYNRHTACFTEVAETSISLRHEFHYFDLSRIMLYSLLYRVLYVKFTINRTKWNAGLIE